MLKASFLKKIAFYGAFIIYFFPNGGWAQTLSAEPADLHAVTLQLKWYHQFNFAGYYAAKEKGFYKNAGLDVTIKAGRPGVNFVEEVVSGRAQFGVEMPELLVSRHRGKDVVVLASIFQHSPQILLALKDSGIRTPDDLVGKRVMWREESSSELKAMLVSESVDLNKIEFLPHSWDMDDLVNGKVDAIHAYVTDQPMYLEEIGLEYIEIKPIDYGINFYGDCIFTSSSVVEENPDRVKAFRDASIKGWQYAMNNPDEIMALIKNKYNSPSSMSYLQNEYEHLRELIEPDIIEIGHINPGRWQYIAETFVQTDMLPEDYSLDGFLYMPEEHDHHEMILALWIMLGTILVIAVVVFFLIIYNRRLNKNVAERTEHLSKEIAERERAERELRASEAFLNSLFENNPNIIFVKKAEDLSFIRLNKACEELLGFPAAELLGKTDYDLFPKEVADSLTAVDREVFDKKEPVVIEEEVKTRYHGSRRLHTIKVPILNSQGEPRFLMGIGQDITEKIKSEEERRFLENKLRQSQKLEAIGTLAGGIAHDFNNILSAIMGYTELAMLQSNDKDGQKHSLEEVLQGAYRAKELVGQILTFSRKSDRNLKAVNVPDLIEEVIKLMRSSIPTTIEIKTNINRECGAVLADPTEIHQLVMNLCTNAYQAMRDLGGVLRISLEPITLKQGTFFKNNHLVQGEYAHLKVSDTGTGMTKEIQNRIFEPYFTTKSTGEGTGLGMAVVHGIVKRLNGDISVYSEPGHGTTFNVYLPLSEENPEGGPEDMQSSAPKGTESILLVDDDKSIVELNSKILRELGYKVTAFTSSMDTLDAFKENPQRYDMLITDMTMPFLTGAELAKSVMHQRPGFPVIVCTGFSENMDEQRAKELGVKALIMKPFNRQELAQTIRKVFNKFQKTNNFSG